MKLKDILKTDTDNKGWLRVFKKLGADAEMLKYVNENISKSGGGGEGVKEYYYKIIGDSTKLSMLTVCTISSIIYLGCKVTNTVQDFINLGQVITTLNDNVTGFSIIGQPSYCIYESEYGLTCNIINSLNFKDKVIEVVNKEGASEEELQAIINTIDSVVQEITKEEYESLITQ